MPELHWWSRDARALTTDPSRDDCRAVINDRGRAFAVRVLQKGDRYGLDDACTANEPMIEFYDLGSAPSDPLTAFVQRYYLTTFADVNGGLTLYGGVPEWRLCSQAVEQAHAHVELATKGGAL